MNASREKIKVGDQVTFDITITDEMVAKFVELSGDDSRIHIDDSFARGKGFSKKIVHGLFLTSLFSRLVGKYFLGDDNLYLAQRVEFKRPVLVGEKVKVAGLVSRKIESIGAVIINTTITLSDGTSAVIGQATVKCL